MIKIIALFAFAVAALLLGIHHALQADVFKTSMDGVCVVILVWSAISQLIEKRRNRIRYEKLLTEARAYLQEVERR